MDANCDLISDINIKTQRNISKREPNKQRPSKQASGTNNLMPVQKQHVQ